MSAAPPLVKQEEGEIVPKYEHEGNVSDADAHLLLAFHMHENRGRASTPPPSASRLSIQALLNATEDTPVPMSAPPRLSTFGRAASPRPSSSRPQPTPILSQPPKPRSRAKPSQPLVLDEPRDTGRSTKSMSISVEPEPTPKPKPKKPKPPKLGKGRGRVSKGPKKRSGRGWIIESCTTSGAPSDADSEPGDGSKSKPVVIKDIFGSDSDLTELEDEESSEEEEYDPGLAAFPPVPASSDSEYEPADGSGGVRVRRRSKVDYGAFQPSARPSVRIAAKAHSDEDEPRTRSKSAGSKSPERQDGESKPSRAKSTNANTKTASGSNTKSTDVSNKSNDTSNKSGGTSNKSGDSSNKSRSVSKSAETSGSRSRSNSGKASSSRRRQLKPPSMSASSVSLGEWQDDPSEVGKPGRKRADSSQKSKADTKSKTDSASQKPKEPTSQKPKPPTRKSLMKARVDSSSLTELTESSPSLGGRNLESPTMAGRNLSSPSMGGDRELGARSDGGVTHVSESVASLQETDGEGERARRWDRYHRDQTDDDEMDIEPVKQRHPPLLVRDYVSQPGRTRRASESERPDKHKHKTFILSGSSPIKPSFESSDDERPTRKRSRSTRSPSNYQLVKVVPMLVSGHPKGCFMLVPPADKRWLTGSVGSSDVGASEPVSSGESKSDVSEEPPAKRPKMSPSKDKGKGRAVDQSVDGSRKSGRTRKPSLRLLESREQDEDEEMADGTPARKQVERSESVSVTGRVRRTSKLTAKALESARQQSEFSEDSGPQIVLVREKSRRASKLTTKALESARQQSELSDGDSEQIILVREKSRRGSRRVERAESSMPGGSKRSHTEGAESSKPVKKPRQDKTGKSLVELSKGDFILRPQEHVCVHYNYDQTIVPRCTACRKKKSGDTCRFRNIRWIKLDPRSLDPVGVKFDSPPEDKFTTVEYHLPGEWNVTPTIQQVERMQVALAQSLYPILRDELAHAQKPNIIRRNVEIEVRATCDVCATSMFSSCHMCTRCGREYCGACFQRVEEMCPVGTLLEYPSAGRKDPQLHKYRACSAGRIFHVPADFYPVTRFTREELDQAVHETEELIQEAHRLASSTQTQITDWVAGVALQRGTSPQSTEPPALSSAGSSHDVSSPRGTPDPQLPSMPIIASPTMSPTHEAGFATDAPAESGKRPASTSQSGRPDPAGIPSHTITSFDKELDEETFKPLWARGEAIVVHDLLDKFKIKWTPQYFKDEYGEQTCQVVNCQDNTVEDTFVSHFFEMFGKADRSPGILKLKDWPAQADFKDDFPTLFEDFMNALPVPNYTRRDGILNLASHFATNAIAPDLGPKMYNAFTSSEGPGGQGSTRLHMDMADAVNIMMYASKDADGSDGVAAWDIFRACDSDKIRAYLRRHFQDRASQFRDPIHSQMFYLDSDHRKKLYEEEQVYSWRIYQKPGDAVFIPAGCAHQVCNLADCIKVAIDFVSLENIHRCERLTTEFRNENDTFTWKEDVLQLRTMMMYAWRSTRQLHLVWDEACEQGGDAEPSEEQSMA